MKYLYSEFDYKKKYSLNDKKWDYYLIIIPILCIILLPLGVFSYISGRMNLNPPVSILVFLVCILLIIICFLVSVVKFMRRNSLKRRVLVFIEICLPVLFVYLIYFQIDLKFSLWGSLGPYPRGYRDWVKSKIDIEEVQDWLKTAQDEYFNTDNGWVPAKDIPEDKFPKSLIKMFNPVYNALDVDEFGNIIVYYEEGLTFWSWGFILGEKDLVYSEDQIEQQTKNSTLIIKQVQPGFYLFSR